MFLTKVALPRRTFLRGMGATLALPLLDAMAPALSAKSVKPTPRLGFVYTPNGFIQEQWIPKTVGRLLRADTQSQPSRAAAREFADR